MQDPTRMSNKMRLLRRLIEYPVTMNEKTVELGKNTRKIVTGAAMRYCDDFCYFNTDQSARHVRRYYRLVYCGFIFYLCGT